MGAGLMGAVLEAFTCEQNTDEWYAARCGIVTMSEAKKVKASGVDGGDSKTRAKYMRQVAAEIITKRPMEGWEGNQHTKRGKLLEPEALSLYSFATEVQLERVGFLRRGRIGCSPDALVVGAPGMTEIKTRLPDLQIELLEADRIPGEHVAQLDGQLLVSVREWVDFVSYSPGLPLFVKRHHRDERRIGALKIAIEEFIQELDALVQRVQRAA